MLSSAKRLFAVAVSIYGLLLCNEDTSPLPTIERETSLTFDLFVMIFVGQPVCSYS